MIHQPCRAFGLILLFLAPVLAQTRPTTRPVVPPQKLSAQERWERIKPFFTPPQEYAGKMGTYRDIMKFDDGTPVRDPRDWPRRREEIRKYWFDTIGHWPPLLEKPRLTWIGSEHVEDFTRHQVKVELRQGAFEDAYILVPDGAGPFPAVLCLGYGPLDNAGLTDQRRYRSFGYNLVKRGFVILSVGGSGLVAGDSQPMSNLAYMAANAHTILSQLKEVDANRIGVIGQSFGGKWALFASCLYDKFACAVWSDPGIVWNENDGNANWWEPAYLGHEPGGSYRARGRLSDTNPRTGAYKKLVDEGHDLHELHALMAPRPFLVSGGEQDKIEHWVPLNHSIALNRFLGFEDRVAMTNRARHVPTVESNEQAFLFFEHFLKPDHP